jgi:hypothetical protein
VSQNEETAGSTAGQPDADERDQADFDTVFETDEKTATPKPIKAKDDAPAPVSEDKPADTTGKPQETQDAKPSDTPAEETLEQREKRILDAMESGQPTPKENEEQRQAREADEAAKAKAEQDRIAAEQRARQPEPEKPKTKRDLRAELTELLKDPELSDIMVPISDTEQMTLADYIKQFPENGAIALALLRRQQQPQPARDEALAKQVEELRLAHLEVEFWGEVRESHPDGRKIFQTPQFREWFAKQDAKRQKLASGIDPQAPILLLDIYKQHVAATLSGDPAKKAADAKKAREGLHSETVRGASTDGRPARTSRHEPTEDEIQAEFDEEFEKAGAKQR